MATPDDVNAQHLAAMGLSEQPLGHPYADTEAGPSQNNEGRCPEDSEGFRCARAEGHDGKHARGSRTWPSPERLAEVFTLSCDDAKAHRRHDKHTYQVGEVQHTCPGYGPQEVDWSVHLTDPTSTESLTTSTPTKQRPGDQALPQGGKECVQDLIIADMEESKRVGLERYGSVLMTFNGRKGFQDVHEEVRDLLVYLTAMRREAEADREVLIEVVSEVVNEIVWGEKSPYIGMKPIQRRTVRPMAEAAVDAIMGWVVGQMNTTTTEEQGHA